MIDVLSDLFILRGVPGHIRSDNGPEFVAKAVQEWIAAVGAKTAYIEPRQPMGERLHRELQRPPARRTAQWRDLLHAAGGADRHRELATPLQHRPAACLDRLQAARPGGVRAGIRRMAGCAGVSANVKLTFQVDHSMKTGQSADCSSSPNKSSFRKT